MEQPAGAQGHVNPYQVSDCFTDYKEATSKSYLFKAHLSNPFQFV